jgi:hypothetical protein
MRRENASNNDTMNLQPTSIQIQASIATKEQRTPKLRITDYIHTRNINKPELPRLLS